MVAKPMSLELVPLDPPPAETAGGSAQAGPESSAPPPKASAPPLADPSIEFVTPGAAPIDLDATQPIHADRYLREATLQYQEGHVDAPLWTRALAQANGDKEAAAAIYVKSRAIALRMLERERRLRQPAAPAPDARPVVAAAMPDFGGDDDPRHPPAESLFARFRVPIIAAGVSVPLLVGGWLAVGHFTTPADDPAAMPPVKAAAAAPSRSPAVATKPAATAKGAGAPAAPAGASPDLLRKIDELREAKNWNLLVLYLVEWTRRDPANVDAWNQLRAGYVTLRQYDDALTAAKKAVELAPADARMWARVGEVQLYRDDPAAALPAFEEAVARDDADVDSRLHIGMLHAQLGRAAEAKAAFDGALVIAPGDAQAQCLRTSVAQITASPGDTYGRARQVRAIDEKCRAHAGGG
ncbi:MAG: hypothetical protein U1F58_03890 [Burkholderiales bacterium]